MRDARTNIRDALYEAPGPRTRRLTAVGTALTLAALTVLIALVIRRFYEAAPQNSCDRGREAKDCQRSIYCCKPDSCQPHVR